MTNIDQPCGIECFLSCPQIQKGNLPKNQQEEPFKENVLQSLLSDRSAVICKHNGYSTATAKFYSPQCYSVEVGVVVVTVLLYCRLLSCSLHCYWLHGWGFHCDWTSSWSCHSAMFQCYWAMRHSVGGACPLWNCVANCLASLC